VLRRLLVPCDFSDRSAAVLQAAVEIARRCRRAKCLVLHVSWTGSRFTDTGIDRENQRQLRQAYDRFLAGIDSHGVTVEPLFVEGCRVDQQIERAAARHRVDLVVVSTRGRTRCARVLLPSTTDLAIRRCQASFLVLRGADRPVGLVQALRERLGKAEELHFS
jgi:nucleotide-binding universal stress UspA family protein